MIVCDELRKGTRRTVYEGGLRTPMQGKLVVIVVLLMGVVVGVAGVRYAFDPAPVWERFDQRRDPLTPDISGPKLLFEQTNDFRRVEFTPVEPDAQGLRRGSATYKEVNIRPVTLLVQQVAPGQDLSEFRRLARQFERDMDVSRLAVYEDALVPYLYVVYAQQGRAVYEFVWVNDGWLFRAYADETDPETLLRFVNSYPN
jgi:hypothetical protein